MGKGGAGGKEGKLSRRHPLSRVQKELTSEEGPQVLSGSLFWVLPLASSPSGGPGSMKLTSFF